MPLNQNQIQHCPELVKKKDSSFAKDLADSTSDTSDTSESRKQKTYHDKNRPRKTCRATASDPQAIEIDNGNNLCGYFLTIQYTFKKNNHK